MSLFSSTNLWPIKKPSEPTVKLGQLYATYPMKPLPIKEPDQEPKLTFMGTAIDKHHLPRHPQIGDVYYLESTRSAYACDGEKWVSISGADHADLFRR